jgi:hypothetical protein
MRDEKDEAEWEEGGGTLRKPLESAMAWERSMASRREPGRAEGRFEERTAGVRESETGPADAGDGRQ